MARSVVSTSMLKRVSWSEKQRSAGVIGSEAGVGVVVVAVVGGEEEEEVERGTAVLGVPSGLRCSFARESMLARMPEKEQSMPLTA